MLNDAKCGIHEAKFSSEIFEKYFNKIYKGKKYLIPNCIEWKKQWTRSGLQLRMNLNHWEVWQTFTLLLHNWDVSLVLQSKLPDCGHSLAKKCFLLSPFHVLQPLFSHLHFKILYFLPKNWDIFCGQPIILSGTVTKKQTSENL